MSNLIELVDEVWPHKDKYGNASYRENQQEAVLDILRAFYEDEIDNYILSAPTGFGKSPVAYTVSIATGMLDQPYGSLEDKTIEVLSNIEGYKSDKAGYYVTPQNILLDQLEDDYGDLRTFGMVKGRNNYRCKEDPTKTCAEGPCRFDPDQRCTRYKSVQERAFNSAVTNTNFSLFMIHPDIEYRPALVVDEAHMMPSYVLNQVEIKLRSDQIEEFGWTFPNADSFQEYVDWLKPKEGDLERQKQDLEKTIKVKPSVPKKLARRFDQTRNLKNKVSRLLNDWEFENQEWVVQEKQEWDGRKNDYVDVVQFRPVTPYRFMNRLVFSAGKKSLISSATPPFPEFLGIENESSVKLELGSPFLKKNRPCIIDPIGKMSSNNRANNAPEVAKKAIEESEGKTIIHSHTYKFAEQIADELEMRAGNNEVILQDQKARETSLANWTDSDSRYFVSVNMYDGIDLKGDDARTNIIAVVPFPYLGDPQIQKRKEVEGDRFFNWETAMKIQQAYGRTTRSKGDWSKTFILDSNFKWFFHANKEFFFDWFKEAIEWR